MADVAVEIPVCEGCGAEVRTESVFCYNCGVAVVETTDVVVEQELEKSGSPDTIGKRPPLTSAASLRKKKRATSRQPVYFTWETPSGPPMKFFIATILLTLGAMVLLVLAFYMR